jgi:anti-anti-sigma factor
MQIDRTDLGSSLTKLKLAGRLDISGAAIAEIPIALAAKNSRSLIIDMSDVSYVASLGVRHLVMAAKTLDRGGGKLVLFAVSEPITEVLTTMGIVELIPVAPTEAAALDIAAAG